MSEYKSNIESVLANAKTGKFEDPALNTLLAQDPKLFLKIIETSRSAIWMIDENLRFTFANKKMQEILGMQADELIGLEPLSFVHDDDIKKAQAERNKRSKGQSNQYELRLVNANDKIKWLHVTATPLYDENQLPVGTFAIGTDITENKHNELQIADYQNKLEKMITDRTTALDQLNQQLEQEMNKRRQAEEKLRHDAYHDGITGLRIASF